MCGHFRLKKKPFYTILKYSFIVVVRYNVRTDKRLENTSVQHRGSWITTNKDELPVKGHDDEGGQGEVSLNGRFYADECVLFYSLQRSEEKRANRC